MSTPHCEFSIDKDYTTNILPINILFSIAITMESGSSIDDVINGLKSFSELRSVLYTLLKE